jgi:hypothetical protein
LYVEHWRPSPGRLFLLLSELRVHLRRTPDKESGLALGSPIPYVSGSSDSRAMGTAKEAPANFGAVAYHPAGTMLANGSHGLNCTFKAVERMLLSCSNQLKSFVIFIATNFTRCHNSSYLQTTIFQLCGKFLFLTI